MVSRKTRQSIATAALMAAFLPAARAHAYSGGGHDLDLAIGGAIALLVLAPSDVGVAVPTVGPSTARLVIGWSWQLPLARDSRHRLLPSLDLLPQDKPSVRGRFGYRYTRRHAFAGAGVGLDAAGVGLSPEIGLKFAHAEHGPASIDMSLHALARAEIAPESGQLRGVTISLAWNVL